MKHFPVLLLTLIAFIFTGCFDILEDISFKKDGSGTYLITFDMNQIINDPFMKEMLLESVKNDTDFKGEKIAMDSVIYFKDDPQFASLKDKSTLWESAKMHMVINEEKGKMFVNFGFDFNEVSDIDAFFKALNKDSDAQNMFAGFDQIVGGSTFVYKKKTLTRLPFPESDQTLQDNLKEDEMAMLKMFMTESELKTSYSFPGKVKKSSIPNSVIDGNEVSVAVPLLDLMDGSAEMDGEIKFKN